MNALKACGQHYVVQMNLQAVEAHESITGNVLFAYL